MENKEKKISANRKFGFLFSVMFAFGIIFLSTKKPVDPEYLLPLVLIFLITFMLSIFYPNALSPFNSVWMKFGMIIGKIMNPIIMGLIFFGMFTPIAIFLRLIGRDELRLKKTNIDSFWKQRNSMEPKPKSFKNQF
tara:strand:- start:477 stop:884 length:408 start_codon:yes stop_codon:yes gene_type:complete